MTFPCYKIPPELYEHLTNILAQGDFDSVSAEPDPGPPEGYSMPKNPTLKVVVVRLGKCEAEVSAYFDSDPSFGFHKARVLIPPYPRNLRTEAQNLKRRIEKLLEASGAIVR